MKKITNLIIIDASGSMESKKQAVIDGLKELLSQIKIDAVKDQAEVETSTIVIDFSAHDDIRTLVNAGNSVLLQDDVSANYSTRGATALYDAIGYGFRLVPEGETKVFVSILTDGEENASREFGYQQVKELIENKKKLGWVITFQGTTEAAINKAQAMGISGGNTMCFTNSTPGVYASSATMSNARTMYYASNTANLDSRVGTLSEQQKQDLESMNMDELLKEAEKKTKEDGKH